MTRFANHDLIIIHNERYTSNCMQACIDDTFLPFNHEIGTDDGFYINFT